MTDSIAPARNESSRRKLLWLVVGAPWVLLGSGLVVDLLMGLPLTQRARSPLAWVIGVTALGALYVLGEWSGEWIHARDSVHHPLLNRVTVLAALLLTGGLLLVSMWYVISLAA
jgi:hypothetical protein